jgi:hypothetical protein
MRNCVNCDGAVEQGQLTGNMGRWWGGGKLGWLPWPPKLHHNLVQGESLVESMGRGVRVPAFRCRACRLVWFSYQTD